MTYLAKCKHGNNLGAMVIDNRKPSEVAKTVSEWIRKGYIINHQAEGGVTMKWCEICLGPLKNKQAELL
jgi:hypothetical protein